MTAVFEGAELIQFAVQLETNGHEFYRQASARVAEPASKAFFDSLASQELEHKAAFERMFEDTGRPPVFESYPGEYALYMKAYVEAQVFTDARMKEILARPRLEAKEAVRFGIESEKDAILYYAGLLEAVRSGDRAVIERILIEERKHFSQLVRHLQALR
jgi:rubrerythrin